MGRKKKALQEEDLTKFDPNLEAQRKYVSYLRKSYSKYPSEISSRALLILESILDLSIKESFYESSKWLLDNVAVEQLGKDKFADLFFVLAGMMVNLQMAKNINPRLAEIGRDFFQKCEGVVDEESFHYNIANTFFELSEIGKATSDIDCYLWNQREGRRHLKQCLDINPAKSEAILNLANSYNSVGRELEAIEICENAIRVRPDHQIAYSLKGELLVKLAFMKSQVDEAIKCLNMAWSFPVKTSRVACNLGQAYLKLGEHLKATEFFQTAVDLANDYSSEEKAKWFLSVLERQK